MNAKTFWNGLKNLLLAGGKDFCAILWFGILTAVMATLYPPKKKEKNILILDCNLYKKKQMCLPISSKVNLSTTEYTNTTPSQVRIQSSANTENSKHITCKYHSNYTVRGLFKKWPQTPLHPSPYNVIFSYRSMVTTHIKEFVWV